MRFKHKDLLQRCVPASGLVTLCLFAALGVAAANDAERPGRLAELLELSLVQVEDMAPASVASIPLLNSQQLPELYDALEGQPAWVNSKGLSPQGKDMLGILQSVHYEGLNPTHYHSNAIAGMLQRIDTQAEAWLTEARAMRQARAREIQSELIAMREAERLAAELARAEEAEADADEDDDVDDEGDLAVDDDDDDADDDADEDDGDDGDDDQSDAETGALNAKLLAESASVDLEAELASILEKLPEPQAAPPPNLQQLVSIELLLSDASLALAKHRAMGVLDPLALDLGWHIPRRQALNLKALYAAIKQGQARTHLQALKPAAAEYLALETAMQRYVALVERGGWKTIPGGSLLKPDSDDDRVPAIRSRLQLSGDLAETAEATKDDEEYAGELVEAVKRFQTRHGLKVDAVIGPQTLAKLNWSAKNKLRTLSMNLERWRWLPEDLGERHIRVNVPAFHVAVLEKGKVVLEMPAIVGQTDRRTPNFSETLKYLVANPTWEVPPSIAKKDKLPILRENLAYLTEHGFDVLSGWGENEAVVDAATLDWSEFNEEYFPYHLRQQPGPTNALGRIKFMLPNRFNIYLHDTPTKHLFDATTRTFSSGCIRLQRPLELADYILANDPRWKKTDIREVLEGEPKQILRLKQHIPVHILYFTAWVDSSAVVHFREDVYNRDAVMFEAMNRNTVALQ